MRLKDVDYLELPASADMHVHLRQGPMMELVVPEIRRGGVETVFVMVRKQIFSLLDYGLIEISPIFSHPSRRLHKRLSTEVGCNRLSQMFDI